MVDNKTVVVPSRLNTWLLGVIGSLIVAATIGGVVLYAEVKNIGPALIALEKNIDSKIDSIEARSNQSDAQLERDVDRLRNRLDMLIERVHALEVNAARWNQQ